MKEWYIFGIIIVIAILLTGLPAAIAKLDADIRRAQDAEIARINQQRVEHMKQVNANQ